MRKIMLIHPWCYFDVNITYNDFRNRPLYTPYNILHLSSVLKHNNIPIRFVDLEAMLVKLNGSIEKCLLYLKAETEDFKPDVIGISFFSIHVNEVIQIVNFCREVTTKLGLDTILISGGIHSTVEPKLTLADMDFDYAFVGEADLGIIDIGYGVKYSEIQGLVSKKSNIITRGREIVDLDSLPYLDWSLCDYKFYTTPSGKTKLRMSKCLDIMLGRGCVNKCAFCAFPYLGKARFHSAEYVIEEIDFMIKKYEIDSVFFMDSSIGNNRKLLTRLCDLLIERNYTNFEWYAFMRADQVNEEILVHMQKAGCNHLFYGFESGSQKVLDLMDKRCTVEQNITVAKLHEKLNFPYYASILLGFPGETEDDIKKTIRFMKMIYPTDYAMSCFSPLPGSNTYEKIKNENFGCPPNVQDWRELGNTFPTKKVYADIEYERFIKLYNHANTLAYNRINGIEEITIQELLFDLYVMDVENINIAVFGTGKACQNLIDEINKLNAVDKEKLNILFFLDNNPNIQNTLLFGKPVLKPSESLLIDIDMVLIASSFCNDITLQLKGLINDHYKIHVYVPN